MKELVVSQGQPSVVMEEEWQWVMIAGGARLVETNDSRHREGSSCPSGNEDTTGVRVRVGSCPVDTEMG